MAAELILLTLGRTIDYGARLPIWEIFLLRPRAFLLVVLSALSATASPVAGDLIVQSWELDSGVSSSSSNAFASTSIVQNPYQQTLVGTLANSYASTAHDFGWTGDSAHFDAYPNHYLQQLEGITVSEGRIHLVPAIDSTVTLQGTLQYAWPSAALGGSVLYMSVFDLQMEEAIVFESEFGGNFGLGPPFGTLNVDGSGLLQAGRLYELYYLARIDHFDPTPPGTHGEASGEIHFSIVPVPESATLALVLPAALALRRRR